MRWLDACERALRAAVEQWPLRIFGARLEPVHLQRALERLVDRERLVWSDGPVVPNRFVILLNPVDLQRFEHAKSDVERDLASATRGLAARHAWRMDGAPRVTLRPDDWLRPGAVVARVDTEPIDEAESLAVHYPPTERMAKSAAQAQSVQFTLADGRTIHHSVFPITIGRGSANAVVIDDPRVSRQHAEIYRDSTSLVLRDIESTNGTWVDGERIDRQLIHGTLEVLLGGYPLIIRIAPI